MAAVSRRVSVRFDGDTKGLAVAAKNGERIVDRFADNASRTVTSRFRTWFTGRGAGEANTVGNFFARSFGSGLLSGFSVPVFGPAMLAVLLGVVAVVAPAVGAALAAGVVLAFGAGLAGLGIVFAAQSEQVKAAFTDLKDSVVGDLKQISAPFQDTLVQIAGFMQRTFSSFRPILAQAFAGLAPIITTFADQFFGAVEKFKPAVAAIGDAFGDLLGSLGPKLPALFADISDSIEGIADTVSENSQVFADLITFFVDAADKAVEFAGALAEAFVFLREQGKEFKSDFVGAFDFIRERGPQFAGALHALNPFAQTRAEMEAMLAPTEAAAGATDAYADSLGRVVLAMSDYADAQRAAVDPVFALVSAMTAADAAQTAYNDAVKEFGVGSAEASAAAVAAAQAVAGLEQAALSGDISFRQFDAKLRQWVASGQLTAAQAEAIRVKVRGAKEEAEGFVGNYEATVAVQDRATAALRGIREWLDRIQSKTVTITARSAIPAGVSIRQLMERQHGGPVVSGRSYLVGENGPEILTMRGESGDITPNSQLDRATGGSNGNGGSGGGKIRLHPDDIRALGEVMGRVVLSGLGSANSFVSRSANLYARTG